MPTSATASWNPIVQDIINAALRKIGALGEDETANTNQLTNAEMALNGLLKAWMAMGLHVWTEEEGILFLQPGQRRYLFGATATDNACDANSYVQTSLTSTGAAAATTIQVGSITGIANAQNIGVVLDAGTVFWTTVSGAPSGSTVTLAAGLPSQATSGALVFTYASRILRPLKVPNARTLNLVSGLETPMTPMSRQEYMDLPNKASTGVPLQWFYAPKMDNGELYLWPLEVLPQYAMRFTWYRPIYDVTLTTQTLDFPQEWSLPLTWALAEEMGAEFDVPPQRWTLIQAKAKDAREMAADWDRESEPILFGVDITGH